MGVMEARRRIMLNQPHLVSASGNPIAFSTNFPANLAECKAAFSPVQAGTGDPAPDNVRPITGWTGCEVHRTGKNLFDISSLTYGVWVDSSGHRNQAEYGCITKKIPWGTAEYVAVSFVASPFSYSIIQYNANGNFVLRQYNTDICRRSSSAASFALQIALGTSGTITEEYVADKQPQLEFGSTATTYEPYSGSSYPVTFPSEAGTLYGGYVDYERGEVVATHGQKTIGVLNWGYDSSYTRFVVDVSGIKQYSFVRTTPFYASCFVAITDGRSIATVPNNAIYAGANSNAVYIKCTDYSTKEAFIEAYGTQTFVYELATPIHYPLTPQIIKSLKGSNTVWSDMNGNLQISYWKH